MANPNSKRRCKNCRQYFSEWVKLPTGVFCSIQHATEWAQAKSKADAEKAFKKRTRELKTKLNDNDRGYWLKRAQTAFNAFIRARDANEPCISCGVFNSAHAFHAGHYRSVGAAPELRFEESNVAAQCAKCNTHLSGNAIEYRISLVKRIGIERVLWLEGAHEPRRYSIDDLKEIEKKYKKKLKNALHS